ncbi:alpha/beta hydrolase family protein [Sphingopyxis sp. LK2115]|jgi:predicted dienelactone hydrolase|uniref:alpha/beta hydrolase family protein n=1 Tax=Sphingopyxis sp. LK2115 TaxID=2744558 RepID=UPI00166178EF|nr:alpha/beta hydrolase [Sphingopyxis sp. LK2115]
MIGLRAPLCLAVLFLLLCAAPATRAEPVIGQRLMIADHPPAAIRSADGSTRLRITVWYPAASDDSAGTAPPAARDAPPAARGRRGVILLSHGFGGAAVAMGWFAAAMAEAGYVVIGVDHPGNNGLDPMTRAGAALFFERPGDLRRAYDHVAADAELGPLLDPDRVAAAGFSAGGFTTLALAGARVEPERLRRFCAANPDDGVCRPQIEYAVPIKDVLAILDSAPARARLAQAAAARPHPRIRALLVMAPAIVQAFDPASLATIDAEARFILGGADHVAPGTTNGLVAAARLPRAHHQIVPDAGHYDFLATCAAGSPDPLPFCAHQRRPAAVHRAAITAALDLFARTIGKRAQ